MRLKEYIILAKIALMAVYFNSLAHNDSVINGLGYLFHKWTTCVRLILPSRKYSVRVLLIKKSMCLPSEVSTISVTHLKTG